MPERFTSEQVRETATRGQTLLIANWRSDTEGLYAGENQSPQLGDAIDALLFSNTPPLPASQLPAKNDDAIRAWLQGRSETGTLFAALSPELQTKAINYMRDNCIDLSTTKERLTAMVGPLAVRQLFAPINDSEGKMDASRIPEISQFAVGIYEGQQRQNAIAPLGTAISTQRNNAAVIAAAEQFLYTDPSQRNGRLSDHEMTELFNRLERAEFSPAQDALHAAVDQLRTTLAEAGVLPASQTASNNVPNLSGGQSREV